MRLLPSDPDVQTIVTRIKSGDINLQPDFQRGEVWGEGKKRRLIDSILREWHVPPIHIVEVKETAKQEVLDGQQRLVAIRDFVNGVIEVDGFSEPIDEQINVLHGLTYEELPDHWRRKFDQFTIRVFRIIDYKPAEPGELFFRLNQPTNLTAAEQRNAFFGPARQQVKELVKMFDDIGLNNNFLGFTNSRMAYDDVISKLCFSLDQGTLREKVTANNVTNKYRSQEMFSEKTISKAKSAINMLGGSRNYINSNIRFNKATLYSWLCFITEIKTNNVEIDNKTLGDYISFFEYHRENSKKSEEFILFDFDDYTPTKYEKEMFSVYNDRASSRVADITSVLARDIIIWLFFMKFSSIISKELSSEIWQVRVLKDYLQNYRNYDPQYFVNVVIDTTLWGRTL
ncbi:DUF262 domain-containing protein [Paenibacillus chitinolyticus]|uniref:DUF262 domain-containing protein n=1 Tax=Paenibacillus chitinolyticus TaxID=79263 RepID=UPI0036D9036B